MYRAKPENSLNSGIQSRKVFDMEKFKILNFPTELIYLADESNVEFIINNQNKVRGNIKVNILTPSSRIMDLPLRLLDTENYLVQLRPEEIGKYSVFVKFNEFDILTKPYTFDVQLKREFTLPIFNSDATKVKVKGLGINNIYCNVRNEFTVDCSDAGTDVLYAGITGLMSEKVDEFVIKHIRCNIYVIYYTIQVTGKYILRIKYGDKDVTGSPFYLEAVV